MLKASRHNGCFNLSAFKTHEGEKALSIIFLGIVLTPILATIGGATGWEDIELYAESHQTWLATFLDRKHGIPHADTYRRVFERIAPDALQECFLGLIFLCVQIL
jgi:hypothetical protein